MIVQEGTIGDRFFLINKGRVIILRNNKTIRGQKILAKYFVAEKNSC